VICHLQKDGAHLSECLINNSRVLEVIVREKVELVEEVTDIYAAQGIHLREREYARVSVLLAGHIA
jgi:hypothetical protein